MGDGNFQTNGLYPDTLPVSESRYRRLFESANYGILILDADTLSIIDINPFVSGFFGLPVEEIIGRDLVRLGVFTGADQNAEALKNVREKGEFRCDGLWITAPDGEKKAVELIGSAYSEGGNQTVQCSIRDITKRKRVEEELKKREEFLQVILANLTDGIVACDADSNLTLFNRKIQPRKPDPAIPPEEWAARFELYTPDGKNLMRMEEVPLYRALHEESVRNVEMATRDDNGRMLTMINNGQALFDENGEKTGAVIVMHDITERKEAEEALREAKNKYRGLVESSPGIVIQCEPVPPHRTTYVSPNIATIGYTPEEWSADHDMWWRVIHEDDREQARAEFELAAIEGREAELECRIVAKDGTVHWWQNKGRFVLDEDGNKIAWQRVALDITATKDLQRQLRQAQKLESVGLLAGGIAHDFNNMLTAINGYSELTLRRLPEDSPLRGNIEEVRNAGRRSASLIDQLLAFSRRQVLQPVVMDFNEVIDGTIKMLRILLGENIELNTALHPRLGRVIADPGQFSQIIINLAVNARDAMPEGGKLTIETANIFLDPAYTRTHIDFLPGAYVMMAVSDTGMGMSEEIQQKIFEPFFTTKDIGKGTGLGLATVYGIVKQSGGNIEVYSEEGVGSSFKIYMPRVMAEAEEETDNHLAPALEGSETVLLVEDEAIVRALARQILIEFGYTVIEARDGVEALEIYSNEGFTFDLLLTDVVMPRMGGRELAGKLLEQNSGLPVLFISGYTDDAIVRHGVIGANANFVQKPFSPETLVGKIREILDNS